MNEPINGKIIFFRVANNLIYTITSTGIIEAATGKELANANDPVPFSQAAYDDIVRTSLRILDVVQRNETIYVYYAGGRVWEFNINHASKFTVEEFRKIQKEQKKADREDRRIKNGAAGKIRWFLAGAAVLGGGYAIANLPTIVYTQPDETAKPEETKKPEVTPGLETKEPEKSAGITTSATNSPTPEPVKKVIDMSEAERDEEIAVWKKESGLLTNQLKRVYYYGNRLPKTTEEIEEERKLTAGMTKEEAEKTLAERKRANEKEIYKTIVMHQMRNQDPNEPMSFFADFVFQDSKEENTILRDFETMIHNHKVAISKDGKADYKELLTYLATMPENNLYMGASEELKTFMDLIAQTCLDDNRLIKYWYYVDLPDSDHRHYVVSYTDGKNAYIPFDESYLLDAKGKYKFEGNIFKLGNDGKTHYESSLIKNGMIQEGIRGETNQRVTQRTGIGSNPKASCSISTEKLREIVMDGALDKLLESYTQPETIGGVARTKALNQDGEM